MTTQTKNSNITYQPLGIVVGLLTVAVNRVFAFFPLKERSFSSTYVVHLLFT